MADAQHKHLYRSLRAVWKREQLLLLAQGGLAFVRWGLVLFLLGVLLDWLIKLPVAGRAAILVVVLGGTLFKAWQAGWRGLRWFQPVRTALQVEREAGGLQSLLVSAVQLVQTAPDDALVRFTCGQAEQAAGKIRPRDTVRFAALRRSVVLAGMAVLLLAGVALVRGGLLAAGVGRIFTPWVQIAYPTRTQLILADGNLVVQEGQPANIVAQIAGVVPRDARLYLSTGSGRPRVHTLEIEDGQLHYMIDTAYRSFEYRLRAGDARSEWYRVEVIHAPVIEKADVTLAFPAYTLREPETVDALTVTVPETTLVRWHLRLDRPVQKATLDFDGSEPLPLEISADGRTVSIEHMATQSRAYGFSWIDRDHGFAFTSLKNYLQVAPDRPPRVELTVPAQNMYATLGRKIDLAFRGRDDHGIGESVVAYRIDKTEETRVAFEPATPIDGTEQGIDWDYREVLPDLEVGQTVTFAVELADRYPGPEGPHRVRSEARWVQFMSREQYLARAEEEMRRLLSQLKAMYGEERKVHQTVLRLDPADPVFVQNCQLEAVRQGLMRDRLNGLAARMQHLADDLVANQFTNHPIGVAVSELRKDVLRVSDEHLAAAAPALRALAGEAGSAADVFAAAKGRAVAAVDDTARELGLLVLRLGFKEAADVMARELHAAAATQAALRLRTIVGLEKPEDLAGEQERLSGWLQRLFTASPKDRESTVEEALTAFLLKRTVKQMLQGGMVENFAQSAAHVRAGLAEEASRVQSEIVQSLLKAEFRLGIGAERNALDIARRLLETLTEDQAALQTSIADADAEFFEEERSAFAAQQAALHRRLQLLLMPEVPARRARLLELFIPAPPPVTDLLSAADTAMTQAAQSILAADREAALQAQEKAGQGFAELAGIAKLRIAKLTLLQRADRLRFATEEIGKRFAWYTDRQIGLLEKTEDADAEGSSAVYLADRQATLADAVELHMEEQRDEIENAAIPAEHALSLPACLAEIVHSMRTAEQLLRDDKPGEAVVHQEAAKAAIGVAQELFSEHLGRLGPYIGAITTLDLMSAPAPLIDEIIQEQRDMLALARQTKPEDLGSLALDQRNLVHAVDAVLGALAVVSTTVESGVVTMFAQEDMRAAATAMEIGDAFETLDAQDFIVESLQELHAALLKVVPQYVYVLEIIEAVHETAQEGVRLREAVRRLRLRTAAGEDSAALAQELTALMSETRAYADLINRITGLGLVGETLDAMTAAGQALAGGDREGAMEMLLEAQTMFKQDAMGPLALCLGRVSLVPGASTDAETKPQEALLKQVLDLALTHIQLAREHSAAEGEALQGLAPRLEAFAQSLEPFIAEAQTHKISEEDTEPANLHLKLVAAKEAFARTAAAAKAGDRDRTLEGHVQAAENLRHFIIDYAMKFLKPPPGPPPPPPPQPTDILTEQQDDFMLYLPGAVSGRRPPDGRAEWQVLGRRERAALNENFARELPLEHREMLKNYYERLAR